MIKYLNNSDIRAETFDAPSNLLIVVSQEIERALFRFNVGPTCACNLASPAQLGR